MLSGFSAFASYGRAILYALLLLLPGMDAFAQRGNSAAPVTDALPPGVEKILIRTTSDQNGEIPFYLRVPQGYRADAKGKAHRLLFLCPIYNGDGLKLMADCREWQQLADERQWFIMTCTFRQRDEDVRNRDLSYYYPERFSGKATLQAIALAGKKYPIDTERLLMQGLSGGAQFVHRFAMWAPEKITAVAINSSSWFDAPNVRCGQVAWLVTIGESDSSYTNSLEMVDRLKRVGVAPVFRSFIGMVHEGSEVVTKLDMEFLKYYDDLTRKDLGVPRTTLRLMDERPALKGEGMPYVGDNQSWKYAKNTSEWREEIPEDFRIFLPSEGIAKIWGQKEEE
jgi:hypothetical protein